MTPLVIALHTKYGVEPSVTRAYAIRVPSVRRRSSAISRAQKQRVKEKALLKRSSKLEEVLRLRKILRKIELKLGVAKLERLFDYKNQLSKNKENLKRK